MTLEDELALLRAENARLAAVEAENARLTSALAETSAAKAKLERLVKQLEHKLQALCKQLFGRSSEKIDPNQLPLDFPDEEEGERQEAGDLPTPPADVPDGEVRPAGKRRGHGRRPIPRDLPRRQVEYEVDPADRLCDCCGEERRSIGSPEITEHYDYQPGSVVVVEHIRPRLRCPRCQDGTVVAPLPAHPIDRGRADPGLLAFVATSKYADHLPLYRVQQILARQGVHLHRSTLCDWVHETAVLLRLVVDAIKGQVLNHFVVALDETGLRVVFDRKDPKNGTRHARIWAYRGQDGDVFYAISETKAAADPDGPLAFLGDYEGYIQADAAGTFDGLFVSGRRLEVGCNAHARRKWVEAKDSSPREVAFALTVYRRVYEIEARFRDATPEQRLAARQAETKPILEAFDEWLDALAASPALVPGTPLATAVGYSRNHRVALRRFLEDGRLSPDNNATERALRLVALGRKNWLFAGSREAADDAAVLYTLVGSCKELGIDPWAYLRDVIGRVRTHPRERMLELTPRRWWEARQAAEAAAAPT